VGSGESRPANLVRRGRAGEIRHLPGPIKPGETKASCEHGRRSKKEPRNSGGGKGNGHFPRERPGSEDEPERASISGGPAVETQPRSLTAGEQIE